MKRYVCTYNAIEGFHQYKKAPAECAYLRARHRHIFVIRCEFEVSHNDREIEINIRQKEIEQFLRIKHGKPCEFKDMSCEAIAEEILENWKECCHVEVREDGYGGAALAE